MKEIFDEYKWPIIGGIGGLILAVLLMTLGFFKTLLILILMVVGVYAGFYLKATGLADRLFKQKP
ncbi:DUF2273 domain-containing protein [Enterococcus sp. LJL128]|uniref:DUF2273 domain-containing protein n=1 Tax=Enterococcus sp. LJL51 TaxID=3416656 RepID=UPI003CEC597A